MSTVSIGTGFLLFLMSVSSSGAAPPKKPSARELATSNFIAAVENFKSGNLSSLAPLKRCRDLGDIAAETYNLKRVGLAYEAVMKFAGDLTSDNEQEKFLSQGIVAAIYGDNSIKSADKARTNVLVGLKCLSG